MVEYKNPIIITFMLTHHLHADAIHPTYALNT